MINSLRLFTLKLWQFKNHSNLVLDFSDYRAVSFVGANGRGKTNILDAIYYLCMTKSMFSVKDNDLIQWGCVDGSRLEADWKINEDIIKSVIVLAKGHRKELLIDTQKTIPTKYLGRFPLVVISPEHIELIDGGSMLRRKFLNILLSQTDPLYLANLIKYEKLLSEKNAILKQQPIKTDLLDVYHSQLEPLNDYIYRARKGIILKLQTKLQEYLKLLLPPNSPPYHITYESVFHENSYQKCYAHYKKAEYSSMRSLFGIHKDDLGLYLGEYLFRSVASQGEKKTLLLALKLTEYAILTEIKSVYPILLLDDIFDKLDAQRLEYIQEVLAGLNNTQLFVTDVDIGRTEVFLKHIVGKYYKIWQI